MNQEQPIEVPEAGQEAQLPSGAQTWAQPQESHWWKRLPLANQMLFAASLGCLGIGSLSLLGPPAAEAARQAYHPYTSDGKRETCLSNLQAIARAASIYAQDNDGRLPLVEVKRGSESVTWITAITPHTSDSKPWTCPLAPTPSNGSASYAFNPVLSGVSASSADDPAVTLLFGDGSVPGALSLQPPYPGWNEGDTASSEAGLAFRHEGAAGVVYADGHAGTLDPSGVKEARLWGGSAAARASLRHIAEKSASTQDLMARLRAGDESGAARLLRTKNSDATTASADLLALWEFNAQTLPSGNEEGAAATASQSVDALGWNLAWAWKRLDQDAPLRRLEAHVAKQAGIELERVKTAGLQTRSGVSGGTFDVPSGWKDEVTTSGNYRTLNLRSAVPGLSLYVESATRSSFASTSIPVDWRPTERRIKAKYGSGYRRLSLGSGTLDGQPAGVWEYELDKPGGPRLHKKLVGKVSGWNSTVFAATAPRGSFGAWKATFERVADSL